MDITNDPAATPAQRLDALRVVAADEHFPSWVPESNNHIHTCFSFSPYTPTHAALLARRAGLRVVGSVDHDSIGAAAEMSEATSVLGMGSVTGFEIRARFGEGTPLAQRKLNNPDSVGVAYMTVQGVPAPAREKVAEWLAPGRAARLERTLAMAERANQILTDLGLEPFDPQADMVGISQYANGGGITERHLLAAMASALIRGFGRGLALTEGLAQMGVEIPASLAAVLSDADNPHLMYDLLGVLKANYLDRIYIQPTDELPSAAEVVAFADSVGAIATYAYLATCPPRRRGTRRPRSSRTTSSMSSLSTWSPSACAPSPTCPRATPPSSWRASTRSRQPTACSRFREWTSTSPASASPARSCAAPNSLTSTRPRGRSSRTRPCPPWTPPCTCWAARAA